MPRRVLILAFMFPPIVDGGGFRPFAFARYLPEFGYEPIVLTRPDSSGLPLDPTQLDRLPREVRIERVATGFVEGWNAHFRRRLGWMRPMEALLGRPAGAVAEGLAWRAADRDPIRQWEISWMEPAVDTGLTLVSRHRPAIILATGPPFESLKAGLLIAERTGVPLVADFRDPWTYGNLWNPASPRRARLEQAWERRVVRAAAKVVVVTPSMQRTMAQKYPEQAAKVEMIMNGFEDFANTSVSPPTDRFILSYIGAIMERRLPPVLFEALRRLRSQHPEAAGDVRMRLVGPNNCGFSLDDRFRQEGVLDLIEWVGPVAPDRARELMRASHVLLHIETTASYAISGKLFEYLAARKTVLSLVPPGSDDEQFLQQSGGGVNVGFDDADRLAEAIHARWRDWRDGRPVAQIDDVWLRQFHRREQTQGLAAMFDRLVAG